MIHPTECLGWLAERMIPADRERGLPSGSSVGFLEFLILEKKDALVLEHAVIIENAARVHTGQSLREMPDPMFQELLRTARSELEPSIRIVGPELLKAYYTHPAVREAIGVGSGAPFPRGYSVYAGELELLEPVFERGPIFRNVDSERKEI